MEVSFSMRSIKNILMLSTLVLSVNLHAGTEYCPSDISCSSDRLDSCTVWGGGFVWDKPIHGVGNVISGKYYFLEVFSDVSGNIPSDCVYINGRSTIVVPSKRDAILIPHVERYSPWEIFRGEAYCTDRSPKNCPLSKVW